MDNHRRWDLAGIAVSEETRVGEVPSDRRCLVASQYFQLLEVKMVRGIGRQMFANFRTLIKFVFVDLGY